MLLARKNSLYGKTVKVSGCGRITAGMTVKVSAYGSKTEGMKFHRNSEFPLTQTVIILYLLLCGFEKDSF